MRDFRSVFYIIGILLCIESIALLLPMMVDLYYSNSDWQIFLFSSIVTFIIGLVLYFSFYKKIKKIKIREAFFLTLISWIIIAIFASLPFIY
jgi:Trk-type K+ transport systems, membrane components